MGPGLSTDEFCPDLEGKVEDMKEIRTISLVVFALLSVTLPGKLAAQQHHHYNLIDIGTLGGPKSYLTADGGSYKNLNASGALTGWADTSTPDPFPNSCFDPLESGGCLDAGQAFEWRNGVKTPLGFLPGGANSASNWISANGLIAGASLNGETDPL